MLLKPSKNSGRRSVVFIQKYWVWSQRRKNFSSYLLTSIQKIFLGVHGLYLPPPYLTLCPVSIYELNSTFKICQFIKKIIAFRYTKIAQAEIHQCIREDFPVQPCKGPKFEFSFGRSNN